MRGTQVGAICARVGCTITESSEMLGSSDDRIPLDVFAEDPAGEDLLDDAGDVGPEVERRLAASARSRERLTRETRNDEIHSSAPRVAVEGLEIVPDRRAIQGRFFHPGHESGRAEGFPLDVANSCGGRDRKSDSEVESADPGAEREDSGTYNHI